MDDGSVHGSAVSTAGFAGGGQERTSDPFVLTSVSGKKAVKSAVVKKTVHPKWSAGAKWYVFDDAKKPGNVEFKVYDWNAAMFGMGTGKSKPLGQLTVPLAPGDIHEHRKLDNLDGVTAAGELEFKIELRPGTGDPETDANAAADTAKWFPDSDPPKKEKNQLLVAVVRARSLKIADKPMFGGGPGASDPFVELALDRKKKWTTDFAKKNLAPVWMKQFELPLPTEDGTSKQVPLVVTVLDKDTMGSDCLGRVDVDLSSLPPLDDDGTAARSSWPSNSRTMRPSIPAKTPFSLPTRATTTTTKDGHPMSSVWRSRGRVASKPRTLPCPSLPRAAGAIPTST